MTGVPKNIEIIFPEKKLFQSFFSKDAFPYFNYWKILKKIA